jgi:hypothetical protein
MTPHPSSNRDNSGNGVSCRVEACRRRLRAIRANQKARIDNDDDLHMLSFAEPGRETRSEPRSEAAFIEAGLEEREEAGIT